MNGTVGHEIEIRYKVQRGKFCGHAEKKKGGGGVRFIAVPFTTLVHHCGSEKKEVNVMKKVYGILTLLFVFIFIPVFIPGAFAAYPEKPVEIIVTFQPGGGTDAMARAIAQYAEKYLGQSLAVINKPGASGVIGWTSVAQASKPDGYTLVVISPPSFLMHPIQRPTTKYKLDDFDLVANIVMDPAVIAVRSDSEIKNLNDLMALVKGKAKSVSIGYSGPGTAEAFLIAQLEEQDSAEFNKIPFDGSAPSIVALMGKHIDAVIMNVSEAHTHVQDGNIKVIGVGSVERDPSMPDIPSFKEQGYNYLQVTLRGLAAPKGLPADVLKKLEESIKKAYEDPEFKKKAAALQMPLHYMGHEEYTKFLHEMNDNLKKEWEEKPW